ncbi:phosphatidylglycerophosphatase A [Paenibacillus pasadenensis]|uniref:phosphatidylglycerophosphatase A family protein n=1 Tax=Paenibacillus pasadenensis TaxID=217090 RepID=UPI00203B7670|nr:phosphatidylglycerophosphatase A [Paenibacillus pasadenensis]MCM3746759.1 phosphatidylglycerophosphatase A [Paenibacillus pasadenensis]
MSDPGKYALNSQAVAQATAEWLSKRGITKSQIAELTLFLQKDYYPDLSLDECERNVEAVLSKREVQNAILTGIQLDVLAEEGKLIPPLQEMIHNDEGLYGCDEILALSIVNVYGSIGLTNFGYVDKLKPGILVRLNDKNDGEIHTFLDDIVGAIAAAAASRIAHRKQAEREEARGERGEDVPLP